MYYCGAWVMVDLLDSADCAPSQAMMNNDSGYVASAHDAGMSDKWLM
jgi:hypothetical protein